MNKRCGKTIGLISLGVFALFFSWPGITQAVQKVDALNEYRNAKTQEEKLEKVKALGVDMIDRRIASLEQLKKILDQAVKLEPTLRDSLIIRINDAENGLNALKTEIQTGTDFEAVREKVRSIITGYRVYAVFMPQIRGLAVIDRLRTYQETLDALKVALQAKVDDAEAAGRPVEESQGKIDRATTALANGASFLATAERDFSNMKIDEAVAAHDLFKNGKGDLQNARDSFHQAKTLLREATNVLRELK